MPGRIIAGRPVRTLLSIEGNIGIGKSTLLDNLRERFAESDPHVAFVPEPVDTWERHGLLQAMYSGELGRCPFQLMALTTRFTAVLEALNNNPESTLIITERSIFSDKACFAEVNLDRPAERAAYQASYEALRDALPKDIRTASVLLSAPMEVIRERIAKRNRAAEQGQPSDAPETASEDEAGSTSGGIPTAYLQQLEDAHLDFFNSLDEHERRMVDATQPPFAVADDVFNAINEMRCDEAYSEPVASPTQASPCHKKGRVGDTEGGQVLFAQNPEC
jgi:deoxyadenosine/deoxycytidine kinase